MATLALRIDAPMQSWGIRSKFIERETTSEPTKSGIVGLLGAALGMDRSDAVTIAALAELRMAVRVDREGSVERDYHTASDVPTTEGKGHRTVVSQRYYLADAVFLVLLEGGPELITELERAVMAPHWPLFFGRRAFPPAAPLIELDPERRARYGTGIRGGPPRAELRTHPWLGNRGDQHVPLSSAGEGRPGRLRFVVDTDVEDPYAELRHDHPISFAHGERQFRPRAVRVGYVDLAETVREGD